MQDPLAHSPLQLSPHHLTVYSMQQYCGVRRSYRCSGHQAVDRQLFTFPTSDSSLHTEKNGLCST